MSPWSQFISSLEFDASRLIAIDVTKLSLPKTNLFIYLDYLNHSEFSGNKIRKLYGSVLRINDSDYKNIITIGGNYSNYLYACGFLPELLDKNLVVIIKGHEPNKYGYTLKHLKEKGALLHFYPREKLRNALDSTIKDMKELYPQSIFIPEGGSNEYAHEGFELLVRGLEDFDIICSPVGTLGTYKGIETYTSPNQRLMGYAAHLDYSLADQGNINYDYAFGGFAKLPAELLKFCIEFERTYQIKLDPIYTSKMMFGIFKEIENGKFSKNEKIVAIHTGGLQGWKGFITNNE